ncbi:MAG: lipoyl(octanoyl) transferase LipB [SAR202 cluster bacterium]|nr:lipoyl(octanoyl) transferase LipB [SAR202 cluster bacterium]|tara:strand:+ start:1126 stop:1806 length:681 start_codon:yes stop_codon:yes gene_type:complete
MDNPCLVVDLETMGYMEAWSVQKFIAKLRYQNELNDCLILVQHPHTYTLGRRGKLSDVLVDDSFLALNDIVVHNVDRGGEVTYHGPGQILAYTIFDVRNMGGVSSFVNFLEEIVIGTLATLGVRGYRKEKCTGIWVNDAKIASLGLNISRGITTHGFCLNIDTDLTYYEHIISCGNPEERVTSLTSLAGMDFSAVDIKETIKDQFATCLDRKMEKVDLSQIYLDNQ